MTRRKPGHVGVDAALGAGRRILPPDRVDELAAGDDPVRAHGQDAEDGLLPGLPHPQLLVAVPGRYRAEHGDAQYHAPLTFRSPAAAPQLGRKRMPRGYSAPGRSSRKNLDHLETSG